MSIYDVLSASIRRWYVLAAGLAVTGLVVAALITHSGVYWARTQILLLGPPVATRPNKLDSNSSGLIATAGLIEREMNIGQSRISATSPDVTLLDQGIYDGEVVRLPNNGGQWATNFDQPVLNIEATGSDPNTVKLRIESMTAEAASVLNRRQAEAKVSERNRITFTTSPLTVQVKYVRGKFKRAAGLAFLVGVGLTLVSAALIDAALSRRRRRSAL